MLQNCTVMGNYALEAGGAAALTSNSTLTITDSTLSRNHARTGGALMAQKLAKLNLQNSIFENNSAEESGGVATVVDRAQCTSIYVSMTNNTAGMAGAVLLSHNGHLESSYSTFTNNTAPLGFGGGLRCLNQGTAIFNNVNFTVGPPLCDALRPSSSYRRRMKPRSAAHYTGDPSVDSKLVIQCFLATKQWPEVRYGLVANRYQPS